LGGDACHNSRLLTGERDIGTWENDHGETMCIHLNREVAKETIERIRQVMMCKSESGGEVEVILAHDTLWYDRNLDQIFPAIL